VGLSKSSDQSWKHLTRRGSSLERMSVVVIVVSRLSLTSSLLAMTVHDYKTSHRPSLWKSEEQELCFSTSSRNHVFRVRAFFQPILRLENPEDRTA
jgi:hypothetical protein